MKKLKEFIKSLKLIEIIKAVIVLLCVPLSAVLTIVVPIMLWNSNGSDDYAIGWMNLNVVLGIIILTYFIWEFINVFFIEKDKSE